MARSNVHPDSEIAWRKYLGKINDRLPEPMAPDLEKATRLGFIAGYQQRWVEEDEARLG